MRQNSRKEIFVVICPDCVKGMVVELRTKGQVHPYRETSILTYPEKYIK